MVLVAVVMVGGSYLFESRLTGANVAEAVS